MTVKNYIFDYYPADRFTGEAEDKAFITCRASLEFDGGGRLTGGTHESRFGCGKVLEIHPVEEGYSFAMDMGGGRVCWYRLCERDGILRGTCNPWNGRITCPYYVKVRRTAGEDGSPNGKYDVFLYNGDRDRNAASEELLARGWMELFPAAGDTGGFMDLPVLRGSVCDFVNRDGDYFFRFTQCSSNEWYRLYRTGEGEWQGNVTGYPFHFAWPFHVAARPEESDSKGGR